MATALAEVAVSLARNAPELARPPLVMVIGRLAVHKDYQGKKIGPGLLRDAILRTLQAADIAGTRCPTSSLDSDSSYFISRRRAMPMRL